MNEEEYIVKRVGSGGRVEYFVIGSIDKNFAHNLRWSNDRNRACRFTEKFLANGAMQAIQKSFKNTKDSSMTCSVEDWILKSS